MILIYFDGMSGTGKDSQLKLLEQSMKNANHKFHILQEPGIFRSVIKDYRRREDTNQFVQMSLFKADRMHLLKTEIEPLMNTEDIIALNRSKFSTFVYQQTPEIRIEDIIKEMEFFPDPDLALIFTADPLVALDRITARHAQGGEEISKTETLDNLIKFKERYEAILGFFRESAQLINCDRGIGQIHKEIISEFNTRFNLNLKPALSQYKAIGFDLDKTLYAGSPEIDKVIQNEMVNQVSKYIGIPFEDAYQQFYDKFQDSGRTAMIELGVLPHCAKSMSQNALKMADIASKLNHDQKLVNLLGDAKQNFESIYLITGGNRENSYQKLDKLGIPRNYFDFEIHADDPHSIKRDGEAFKAIAEQMELQPQEILYVGDREKTDIIPAHELGFGTVMIGSQSEYADISLPDIYSLEGLF